MPRSREPRVRPVVVHGHRRAFVLAGRGPALLLLHGLGCDHTTWSPVIDRLCPALHRHRPGPAGARRTRPSRGRTTALGGYANGMRDLLALLGIDKVTVVGHSFGGGVAMQFAYQFPQYTERLMLVAPGGLGREVNPLLRGLTLPGAGPALAVAASPPVLAAGPIPGCARARRADCPAPRIFRGRCPCWPASMMPQERDAFLHVLRAVVDWRGQVVTMTDRAYLAANMPTCVMWGDTGHRAAGRPRGAGRGGHPRRPDRDRPGSGPFPARGIPRPVRHPC